MTADAALRSLPEPISLDGPPVDVPLLRKAVEWAEAEAAKPERESQWYQAWFSRHGREIGRTCGTAYCIAGYVAASLGEVDVDDDAVVTPDGTKHDLPAFATESLGLTTDEAWGGTGSNYGPGLFSASNTIEDVRSVASRIAARAGERL